MDKAQTLDEFPHRGRIVPEMDDRMRDFFKFFLSEMPSVGYQYMEDIRGE